MIDFGEKPSNQTQLGVTDGYDLMQEVREWVEGHPAEWERYLDIATSESAYGEVSPNYAIQVLRHRCRVSIPNSYAPALARLAMEKSDRIRFRIAKSKVDGFCDMIL